MAKPPYLIRRFFVGTIALVVTIATIWIISGNNSSHIPIKTPKQAQHNRISLVKKPNIPLRLPQTSQFPSQGNVTFISNMNDLWNAIVTGNPGLAANAFFPENAYVSLKMISNPASDYQSRLLDQFNADIMAAHDYLGSNVQLDQYLGVVVPSWNVNWVTPGNCYSNTGYFHVPGSRILYRQAGQIYSIGIASLISWRGEWYVVHMGAIYPPANTGIVDTPVAGIGSFPAAGGC